MSIVTGPVLLAAGMSQNRWPWMYELTSGGSHSAVIASAEPPIVASILGTRSQIRCTSAATLLANSPPLGPGGPTVSVLGIVRSGFGSAMINPRESKRRSRRPSGPAPRAFQSQTAELVHELASRLRAAWPPLRQPDVRRSPPASARRAVG